MRVPLGLNIGIWPNLNISSVTLHRLGSFPPFSELKFLLIPSPRFKSLTGDMNNTEKEETDNDLFPDLDWLFDDDHPDSYFMPVNSLKLTEARVVRRVYQLARTVARVFREAALTYWSSGGTTLGIVRHGGLIPWDDDIDLCILEKVNTSSVPLACQCYHCRMKQHLKA